MMMDVIDNTYIYMYIHVCCNDFVVRISTDFADEGNTRQWRYSRQTTRLSLHVQADRLILA